MLKTVKIQKEDEPKKKKRTSRVNARSSKNINQINQEEIKTEKDYTQGQEHIPEHEISEKPENISSTNIQENEQTSNEETSGKKVIKLKPRETHLKDKMNKMQFDESLLSGINKGIEGQLKSLKEDIMSNNVNVSATNNKKFVNKSFDYALSENNKKDNFDVKKKYKEIYELKEEKDALNRKLMQIIENENLLENKNKSNLLVEQNLKEKIKKDVSKQKKEILDKINIINSKIKLLMQSSEDANTKRLMNLKSFLDNFERDKEIAEIRAKKYLKENKQRKQLYINNANLFEEKLKQDMIQKDKEEKENQKQLVLKLRKQAKDLESKQSKKIEQKSLLYKPFINQKVDKTKNYLFMKQYEKFIKNEQRLIDKENNLRKNYMKPFSKEEIDEFIEKMDKKREEKKLIAEEKAQKLQQEWKEREKIIQQYVSPFLEKAFEGITNDIKEEKAKNEQRNFLLDKKKGYGTEIRTSHIPPKNKSLEQKRLATINNLDPRRFLLNKDTLQHHKRKGRVLLKKVDPNKPNKYDWLKQLNKSAENDPNIDDKLIKKPKNYMLSMSLERNKRNKLPNIKFDYLRKKNNEKEQKENIDVLYNSEDKDLNEEENYIKASAKKWDKLINESNDENLIENINNAKDKIQKLEYEALQNEKLMKSSDDINQSVELNKRVSNLIIDSIQAKITLLQKMK
jgi:hypothetical protein